MSKIKWSKDPVLGHTTTISEFKVDRVTCNSGLRQYYVHYKSPNKYNGRIEHHMTDWMRSLNQVRRFIETRKGK